MPIKLKNPLRFRCWKRYPWECEFSIKINSYSYCDNTPDRICKFKHVIKRGYYVRGY